MRAKQFFCMAVGLAIAFVAASSTAQQDSVAGQQEEKLAAVELKAGEVCQLAMIDRQADENQPQADSEKPDSVSKENMGVPVRLSSVRRF